MRSFEDGSAPLSRQRREAIRVETSSAPFGGTFPMGEGFWAGGDLFRPLRATFPMGEGFGAPANSPGTPEGGSAPIFNRTRRHIRRGRGFFHGREPVDQSEKSCLADFAARAFRLRQNLSKGWSWRGKQVPRQFPFARRVNGNRNSVNSQSKFHSGNNRGR